MKKLLFRPVLFSTNHPKTVMGVVFLLTVFFILQVPSIRIDTDPENMLSEDEPVRVTHQEVKKDFSLHDAFVLGVVNEKRAEGVFTPETLERVALLSSVCFTQEGQIRRSSIVTAPSGVIKAEGGVLTI